MKFWHVALKHSQPMALHSHREGDTSPKIEILPYRFEALSTPLLQALAHAATVAERRSLLQSLSESEMSRQELQAELSAESAAAVNTSMLLNAFENHAVLLDRNVENLGLQLSKLSVDLSAIKSEKGRLEQLLSAEQRRVDKLERELAESSKAAALAAQVKKRWEEMEELEVKVPSFESRSVPCCFLS